MQEIKDGQLIVTLPDNYPWEPVPDNTEEVMQKLANLAIEARKKREQAILDAIEGKDSN